MSYYSTTVDTSIRNSSQTMEVELVGEGADVLDVGCASGYLGIALQENGCRVSGVELDERDAEKAREVLTRVEQADINTTALSSLFGPGEFDRIVFGDVLEHLLSPERVLSDAVALLRPGGSIIVSVPNVAHGSVRLALLQGRWEYTDTGLLDRTHIQFFTHERLTAMAHEAGLVVTQARATVFDALTTEVEVDTAALPLGVVDWVRAQPYAEIYQFVVELKRPEDAEGPEPTGYIPSELLPPAADRFSQEAEELRVARATVDDPDGAAAQLLNLRHQLLVATDHAIGQEAELGVLRSAVNEGKSRERFLHEELSKAHTDAKFAHAEWAKTIAHAQELQRVIDGGVPGRLRHAAGPVARGMRSAVRKVQGR